MDQLFTPEDLKLLESKAIRPETVKQQLDYYKQGFAPIQLTAPATVKKGLIQLSSKRIEEMMHLFQEYAGEHRIIKFVPASGAASRLFKQLYEFRHTYRATSEDQLQMLQDKGPDSVYYFFEHLELFPFFEDLLDNLEERGYDYETIIAENRYERILNALLTDKGLAYGHLPKAMIPFHKYGETTRTAFEEHLCEGPFYARSAGNQCHIHFTILPEHHKQLAGLLKKILPALKEKYHINYHVTFSYQDPSSDIIAVDAENQPVRDEEGKLVFRPGGHGSLLPNLQALEGDLIIIKNIDNVCHDRLKEDTYIYKQALSGYLIHLQDQIFSILSGLDHPAAPSKKVVDHIWSFIEHKLFIVPPEASKQWKKEEKIEFIRKTLNRPIRVCGMVENEGEPGGGPYWISHPDGSQSLQIVESAQIDLENEEQAEIVSRATHFNPVDIVCSIMDYKGNKFNLKEFADPKSGIITEKSLDGKVIKAQEHPGLWNGSMANWITLFIEVPLTTFNPVKTINDLLRTEHQEFI